jgi:hypothetical protein
MSFVFCSGSNLITITASRLVTFSHIKNGYFRSCREGCSRGLFSWILLRDVIEY